jgi:hypothetical protein
VASAAGSGTGCGRPAALGGVAARCLLVLPLLLLAAVWGGPADANPLTKPEVLKLVRRNVQETRLLTLVRELGIDFKVTGEVAAELRTAGASSNLVAALQKLAGSGEPAVSQPVESSAPAPVAPAPAPTTPPVPSPPVVVQPPGPPPVAVQSPAPPPSTTQASDRPPASRAGAQPNDADPAASDPSPREGSPPVTLEPPPAPTLPPGARDTLIALIPGPPPPPPPRALGSPPGLGVSPPARPPDQSGRPPAAPPAAEPSVAAAPAPAEPPSRWEQVRPLLEKAQALAAEGDVRGAQTLVVKAMEMDPGEPQVWKTFKGIEQDLLVRAETFLADGQLPRALREFQFIISTNPESALGFNGMGQALLQLKNYDEAVAAFEKALALEPGNARYRQALTRARGLQRASKAFERQGQQNLRDMIEDQPGKKKGP